MKATYSASNCNPALLEMSPYKRAKRYMNISIWQKWDINWRKERRNWFLGLKYFLIQHYVSHTLIFFAFIFKKLQILDMIWSLTLESQPLPSFPIQLCATEWQSAEWVSVGKRVRNTGNIPAVPMSPASILS